jgi:hypothetical protein
VEGQIRGSEALAEPSESDASGRRRMKRASRLLRRHGAARAQFRAFNGTPRLPELREPAPDAAP